VAVIKIKCFDPRCNGTPFSVNDGAARLAEAFGRAHYICDKCGTRWSVDIVWYANRLKPPWRPPSARAA
jgi:hypothetical protein